MADIYSTGIGNTPQGVSIDNTRRVFNFGERVAELAPAESPFFSYLSRVAKRPTDDPVFKFLEQRHQWQRRNFHISQAEAAVAVAANLTFSDVRVSCYYDQYGRTSATEQVARFLLVGQVITFVGSLDADGAGAGAAADAKITARISTRNADGATYADVNFVVIAINGDKDYATTYSSATLAIADNAVGQVTGSAFAEATGAPEGWVDSLYTNEGYTQIFKTACPMFSGSSLATRYRGYSNEFIRVWNEKLKEHKMDLEHASLFGVGRYASEDGSSAQRYTWGIVPYTELYGSNFDFDYSTSTYDDFVDAMKDFYAPESGNSKDKLVLSSRKVLAWLQKLTASSGGFLKNTVGSSQYRLDVQNIQGQFGHQVTKVSTIFGNLHFVEEPLLRGMYEDYAVAVDLKNVAYRPLVGNGISRDTHIVTNVQDNDIDGRKDMILTEAGIEIALPETHAILKWAA